MYRAFGIMFDEMEETCMGWMEGSGIFLQEISERYFDFKGLGEFYKQDN
jgi:hypothetical protein